MKKQIPFLLLVLLLGACKPSKEEMLQRKWKAVEMHNPRLEETITRQQAFIDTLGDHTTPDENERIYGLRNTDSMKQLLRDEVAMFRADQANMIENTSFDLRKGHVALLNFGGQPDSAKWYLDDEGALILEERGEQRSANKTRMEIVELNDTLLKLSYNEQGVVSTISLRPVR